MTGIYEPLLRTVLDGEEAIVVTDLSKPLPVKTLYRQSEISSRDLSKILDLSEPGSILKTLDDGSLIMVERFRPNPRLIVFGGGHISDAIAKAVNSLNFELWIYDDRPSFSSPARFPMAQGTICDSFEAISDHIKLRNTDLVVIATRGHRHDEECLRFVLNGQKPQYFGMIGSKRRIAIIKRKLLEEGLAPEKIEPLRSPIGLPIGAITPGEIAISILAQIIEDRRKALGHQGLSHVEDVTDLSLLKWLASKSYDEAALITVTSTNGSSPRKSGAKMVAFFDGRTVGSIGGGCAEAEVITNAREVMGSSGHLLMTIDLTDSAEEDGMVCGGRMGVLIEDISPKADPTKARPRPGTRSD
ncbi:MAG: XdhC family protein [Deltaproteobacteria bacterium]|jgi:xanthine dehydrogenase accessory factor|nr:XdhC family protein [Deltaproteobacteria bacterium]